MPDAVTSTPYPWQSALDAAQGDRQDVVTGGTGRLQQQTDTSADDPRGLRRDASARFEQQPAGTIAFA